MKVDKKEDNKWWVIETPEGVLEMGPYDTKKEAEDIMAGTKRFLKEFERTMT